MIINASRLLGASLNRTVKKDVESCQQFSKKINVLGLHITKISYMYSLSVRYLLSFIGECTMVKRY